jgi:hypothetical protein
MTYVGDAAVVEPLPVIVPGALVPARGGRR